MGGPRPRRRPAASQQSSRCGDRRDARHQADAVLGELRARRYDWMLNGSFWSERMHLFTDIQPRRAVSVQFPELSATGVEQPDESPEVGVLSEDGRWSPSACRCRLNRGPGSGVQRRRSSGSQSHSRRRAMTCSPSASRPGAAAQSAASYRCSSRRSITWPSATGSGSSASS